ncbi:MAG: glycosyltransferase family 87 protein [Pseudomonadota bacterium]
MKSPAFKQASLLGLWSFICVLPLLLKTGPNVVTLTYLEGAQRLFELGNPYLPPSPGRDLFFYPPFFAVLWKALSFLGAKPAILGWALLNSVVFWWGVSLWFSVQKRQSGWAWIFLVCAAVELDISLRYQQANALLAGLILWALSEFRECHYGRAGFLLALGTHLKIFPILFAGLLFLPFHLAFGASFLASLLLLFLLPAWVVGVPEAIILHWKQINSTTQDFSQRQLLDVTAFFARFGLVEIGKWFQMGTALLGGMLLVFYRFKKSDKDFSWGLWYSSFVTMLLAIVPKTESPTFVWMAPAYLLIWQKSPRSRWLLAVTGLCISLVYSSAFPKWLVYGLTHEYNSKVVGNFVLWMMTSLLLLREIR